MSKKNCGFLNDYPNTLPEHILKLFEIDWGFELPVDYRNFLLLHNGGEPTLPYFNFKENPDDGSDVRAFLSLYPSKHTNLLAHIKTFEDRYPKGFFPIGFDSSGNLILIAIKGKERGVIYFWDHETENIEVIRDNFIQFLSSLKE